MTNTETLFTYRLRQADETLQDIENLIASHSSGLSIVNRSYYAWITRIWLCSRMTTLCNRQKKPVNS
jgi:hypothetical protein